MNNCCACIGNTCMEQMGDNEDMSESEFRENSLCWAGPFRHLTCSVSQYCKKSDNYKPELMC